MSKEYPASETKGAIDQLAEASRREGAFSPNSLQSRTKA